MKKYKKVKTGQGVAYHLGGIIDSIPIFCFPVLMEQNRGLASADCPDYLVAKKLGNSIIFNGSVVHMNSVLVGHTLDVRRRNREQGI